MAATQLVRRVESLNAPRVFVIGNGSTQALGKDDPRPPFPDRRSKTCKTYPYAIFYTNNAWTQVFAEWNRRIIPVIVDHDAKTAIAHVWSSPFARSSLQDEYFWVVYKGREPGVYDNPADMGKQIDALADSERRFRKLKSFLAVAIYFITRGEISYDPAQPAEATLREYTPTSIPRSLDTVPTSIPAQPAQARRPAAAVSDSRFEVDIASIPRPVDVLTEGWLRRQERLRAEGADTMSDPPPSYRASPAQPSPRPVSAAPQRSQSQQQQQRVRDPESRPRHNSQREQGQTHQAQHRDRASIGAAGSEPRRQNQRASTATTSLTERMRRTTVDERTTPRTPIVRCIRNLATDVTGDGDNSLYHGRRQPSMGVMLDKYILSHGYDPDDVQRIYDTYVSANGDSDAFVRRMARRFGMCNSVADFIFLICDLPEHPTTISSEWVRST